ncbi:hypothetical protein CJP72_12155 [Citrobacter sp. NCU1]|uniref:hypothetical protein n=1 Tax=Citrobacter sp. NCU1 TaxID=2026683 RepID=UPI001390C9E2|nr:hypothetical protein [Citrobacter sp. NCU1]NDO81492.1 hypothetical protein [Citrobacter sp. NCU1]
MKQSDLPRCPTCGNMPEYALKPNYMGWVWGGLKCPYNHYSVLLGGPAGSRAKAIETLEPQWIELVEKINKELPEDHRG